MDTICCSRTFNGFNECTSVKKTLGQYKVVLTLVKILLPFCKSKQELLILFFLLMLTYFKNVLMRIVRGFANTTTKELGNKNSQIL